MTELDANNPSPIVVIKQKELELADRLAEAHAAAERAIFEAHRWADDARDRAENDGREAAAAVYQAGLEAIDVEAEGVRAQGDRTAAEISERGAYILDQVTQRMLAFVLPRLHTE
jgi:vacuolar-type H+-ATPase subunit H